MPPSSARGACRRRRSASATTSTRRLLQAMADAGGGHFYYIADAPQIRDHIASEVGETLEVVARDVALEVLGRRGRPDRDASARTGSRRAAAARVVTLGDLVSEQGVDVVLRLTFPYGDLGRETGVIVNLTDRDGAVRGAAGVGDRPPHLDLRRRPRQRRPAARRGGRPRGRPPVRGPCPPAGRRAQPRRRLRRRRPGAWPRPRGASAATRARTRSCASSRRARGRAGRRSRPRWRESPRKQAHFASANALRSRDAMGHSRRDA